MVKPRCKAKAEEAKGEKISDKEINDFAKRMAWARDTLRNQDKEAWDSMNDEERILAQSDFLGKQIIETAMRLKEQAVRSKNILSGIINNASDHNSEFGRTASEGLLRQFEARDDGKNLSDNQALVDKIKSRQDMALGEFNKLFTKIGRKWLGLFQDRTAYRAVLDEAIGNDSSSYADPKKLSDIRAAAKIMRDTSEKFRQLANSVGMNISSLKDFVFSHTWNRDAVIKDNKQTFVNKMDAWIDHSAYLDDKGVPMTDTARRNLLATIHDNFIKNDNTGIGDSRIANRHGQRRALHFADADSYLSAQKEYGDPNIANSLISHYKGLSRDIELMNSLGANPDAMVKAAIGKVREIDRAAYPDQHDQIDSKLARTQLLYDYLSGKYEPIMGDRNFAEGAALLRNVQSALHLGYYPIKHVSDFFRLIANTPMFRTVNMFSRLAELSNPASSGLRDMIGASGVGMERFTREIAAYGNDLQGPLWSQKLAKFFVGITGGPNFQAWLRQGNAAAIFNSLGRSVEKYDSVSDFRPADQRLLEAVGITDKHLEVYKLAQQEKYNNNSFLTPRSVDSIPDEKIDALMPDKVQEIVGSDNKATIEERLMNERDNLRGEASRALLTLANKDTASSIVGPSAMQQALIKKMSARGDILGELVGSSLQFKRFSLAMGEKLVDRFNSIPDGMGKAVWATKMAATSLVGGALVSSLMDLSRGKDVDLRPTPLNFMKWASYGASALLSEVIESMSQARSGSDAVGEAAKFLVGPSASMAAQAAYVPLSPLIASAQGDHHPLKKFLDEGAKFVKSNLPFKEWYTGAVIDRLFNREVMEQVNPGGIQRASQKMRQETGQGDYMNPVNPTQVRPPQIIVKHK